MDWIVIIIFLLLSKRIKHQRMSSSQRRLITEHFHQIVREHAHLLITLYIEGSVMSHLSLTLVHLIEPHYVRVIQLRHDLDLLVHQEHLVLVLI